jgi:hypothetical protein
MATVKVDKSKFQGGCSDAGSRSWLISGPNGVALAR